MIHLDNIRRLAASTPDRAVAVSGDARLSWRQFETQTQTRVRLLLTHLPGSLPAQACVVAPNSLNLLPWLAALATLGIPVTGLDYTLPDEALHDLATRLDAQLLLVASSARGGREAALDFGPLSAARLDIESVTQYDVSGTAGAPIEELLSAAASPRPFRSVGLTSGTSGAPKAVVRSRSFDLRRFKYFTERYGFDRNDRFLVSMPLYHAAGNGWARMFMSLGATLVLAPIDSPHDLAEALRRQAVTASVMTPTVLDGVVEALGAEALGDRLSLRWVLVGGKHFPVPQKTRALSRLGNVVYEYYGTTETGVNTIAEPHDLLVAPASVGLPIEGNAIAILGKDGSRLEPYKVGTVAVASYMNMDHYGDGTANELNLDGERYLLAPDQGYLDSEGRLYLVNRGGDGSNASRIYGLEDAIRDLPCVADVALVQRKDMQIDCAIVLRDGSGDSDALHERVRGLASTQHLSVARCRNVARIPYSLTGKIRLRDVASYFTSPSF